MGGGERGKNNFTGTKGLKRYRQKIDNIFSFFFPENEV